MALADSVPGVSGGTIAFLLGFYDQFINSLNNLMYGSKEERKGAFIFLVKLGIGWVVGFGLAVLFLANVFEKEIYKISSVFIGLIVFSIPLIIMEEKKCLKGKYMNLIFTAIGIGLVACITYFNPVSGEGINIAVGNLNIGLGLYIVVAAMIAISAMVLPGISGSTLMLIFGLYVPIITAVKGVMSFDFSYLPACILFGVGVILGVLLVIRLIKLCLSKFRSQTIYTIIGLMIGSLYAIVMGPTTLEIPQAHMTFGTFSIIFFIIGGAIVLGLQKLKSMNS